MLKKTICKVRGHKYSYNFGWMPTKCECKRCGTKWKTINNPEYIPGKSNPLEVDIHIWVEDKKKSYEYNRKIRRVYFRVPRKKLKGTTYGTKR